MRRVMNSVKIIQDIILRNLQDIKCMCNVTLRCIHATMLQWKSSKYYIFWVCVCRFMYPACNAHAPYCHLWPIWLYHIYSHNLINGTVFRKLGIEHKMCVLIFSTTFVWNISHSKKNWVRYDHSVCWSSCEILVTLVRF